MQTRHRHSPAGDFSNICGGRGSGCTSVPAACRSCALPPSAESSQRRPRLLHLVEHLGEGLLHPEGLLDFVARHVRVFAVLEEARTLMFADEIYERRCVRSPVRGKPFELLEDGIDTSRLEQLNRVLGVLVEIGIENTLVHEVFLLTDVEEHPPEVMKLQRCEGVRARGDGVLDALPVGADVGLRARLDLRDDREAVTGWRSRVCRAIPALLEGEVTLW